MIKRGYHAGTEKPGYQRGLCRVFRAESKKATGELDDISKLAVLLDMSAEDVKEKLVKEQALIKIAKYLDKDQRKVKIWISPASRSRSTKRYYPLGNLPSREAWTRTTRKDRHGRTTYLSGVAEDGSRTPISTETSWLTARSVLSGRDGSTWC
ncbi:MAG: hypothetical protein ACLVC5_09565 [Clostridia bacterium]